MPEVFQTTVDEMLAYTAAGADELMTVHYSDSVPNRLRSVELLASALDPAGA